MLAEIALCLALVSSPICHWVPVATVSVTYYHPKYDERCRLGLSASGMRCVYDADVIALGPGQLKTIRLFYADREEIVGAFPRLPCWECEPTWWGYPVKLCNADTCRILRVGDTGSDKLQADLPRGTWQRFGHELNEGRFDAILYVWRCEHGETVHLP